MVQKSLKNWSNKLDDALWAYRTAFRTLIETTPFRLVYRKHCHRPVELEHKAHWAVRTLNYDLKSAGEKRLLNLNEVDEIRLNVYESVVIYKEKTKKWHDQRITRREFKVDEKVLFFNFRLKFFLGKLKSRWFGPYTITQVFPYGSLEGTGANGSFKVNGHRVKHYIAGEPLGEEEIYGI
ncbi:uncharacterized protein LOC130798882 [Amaranthus tricolor]|uniref:uncharacterized protein LOC130798882 n=1 Tax=Amaranthus tricolor TaxID=29722 RepID=UPI00258D7515|nr:uncharacterized protein LOC130798882 [Amaranthus tricolor]